MSFSKFMGHLSQEELLKSKAFWNQHMGPLLPTVTAIMCEALALEEETGGDMVDKLSDQVRNVAESYPNARSEDVAYFMCFVLFMYSVLYKKDMADCAKWASAATLKFAEESKNVH